MYVKKLFTYHQLNILPKSLIHPLSYDKMCIRDRYSLHIDTNNCIIVILNISAGTVIGKVPTEL